MILLDMFKKPKIQDHQKSCEDHIKAMFLQQHTIPDISDWETFDVYTYDVKIYSNSIIIKLYLFKNHEGKLAGSYKFFDRYSIMEGCVVLT